MANRSTFPISIDTFIEHSEIMSSDKPLIVRYQELTLKEVLTSEDSDELVTITNRLRDKLQTAEDFNKLQDSIVNLQNFFRDQVDGYVDTKQNEMNTYVVTKQSEMNTYVDTKQSEINQKVADFITFVADKETYITSYADSRTTEMKSKKDIFLTYVDTKEDEVRNMVQEFDSNSARYYQRWTAQDGQTDFNIYMGDSTAVPPEANLNIEEINIDLIINGVMQTPNIDFVILQNGNYDTLRLQGGAGTLVSTGTEVIAKWYKNVGKLYFSHASTHALGGSDEITGIQEAQLDSNLQNKVEKGGIVTSNVKPLNDVGVWLKIIG